MLCIQMGQYTLKVTLFLVQMSYQFFQHLVTKVILQGTMMDLFFLKIKF